jgi:hypothetical protein
VKKKSLFFKPKFIFQIHKQIIIEIKAVGTKIIHNEPQQIFTQQSRFVNKTTIHDTHKNHHSIVLDFSWNT